MDDDATQPPPPADDEGQLDLVGDADAEDAVPAEDKTVLDRLRNTPVGTQDPNIVGDAGPTDIPPGTDPD